VDRIGTTMPPPAKNGNLNTFDAAEKPFGLPRFVPNSLGTPIWERDSVLACRGCMREGLNGGIRIIYGKAPIPKDTPASAPRKWNT